MCFSATASFAASAILTPLGIHTLRRLSGQQRQYQALAAFPLLFGIQQALEGLIWLNLTDQVGPSWQLPALGFLFFVYAVWPLLVPLAAWQIEDHPMLKRLFGATAVLGGMFGGLLFIPLLMNDGWFTLQLAGGSLQYLVTTIFDGQVPARVLEGLYSAVVILPLLLCTQPAVRLFGTMVLISFVASALLYSYAFISVWCFFAALLSLQVYWLIRRASPANAHLAPAPSKY